MTLTIVLSVKEGMVFATDSRGTIGDPRGITAQNDTIKKQFKLDEHIVIQTSGANETGAIFIDEIQRWRAASKTEPTVTETMLKLREILKSKYDDWYSKLPAFPQKDQPQRPALNLTVSGYERIGEKSLEKIYLLSSQTDFAPQLFNTGICITGIPLYAIYLTLRLYSREMPLDGAKALASYVISETASQDGKVGGPIQMMVIKRNGNVLEVEDKELKGISTENYDVNLKLKELFRRIKN